MAELQLYTDRDRERVRSYNDELNLPSYRTEFRRDYDRLIHSPSFRRLQGKTQLYPGNESDFFRSRLTHSLEVAQIAKTIANKLNFEQDFFKRDDNKDNKIDTDLVEFAALAHDLGHPPFGHNGERALDDCMKSHGGFEGNAQTLHIIAKLEKKVTDNGDFDWVDKSGNDRRLGLNLTYRSLASVLKYDKKIPLRRGKSSAVCKGYYGSESNLVEEIRQRLTSNSKDKIKCIECHIMDIADDIAYSTYDLEDGLKAGFISHISILSNLTTNNEQLRDKILDKLTEDDKTATEEGILRDIIKLFWEEKEEEWKNAEYSVLVDGVKTYLLSSITANNGYARTNFTAKLVNKFIEGIEFEPNESAPALSKVSLNKDIRRQVETLKHLNFEFVTMSSRVKVAEYRGYEMVKTIFEALDSEEGHLLLPSDCRVAYTRLNSTDEKKRLICDFVAGMTDKYAVEFYSRIKGGGQTIFKPL